VFSVSSCEEEEGEGRHGGGQLCMPLAIASCSCVDQRGRRTKSTEEVVAEAEARGRIVPRAETLN